MATDPRVVALIVAIVALIAYLCLIGLALRMTRQRYAVRLLVGCAALVYGAAALWAQTSVAQWHLAAFFGVGVAATMFTYGAALKALSLRMLMVIAASPAQAATAEQLTDSVIRASFQDRIALLEEKQLIARSGGGFALTPAGVQAAARIRAAQQALSIGGAGFYWD
jgi:peptidoglycan/LPS O-acetylase OafA/YrhL